MIRRSVSRNNDAAASSPPINVDDGSLPPLHSLTDLRDIFIAKMFSPADLRALGRALPGARGELVDSHRAPVA